MTNTAVSRRYEWQNKIIRIIFSFFIAIGAILHIAPFSIVNASSPTYYEMQNNVVFRNVTYQSATSQYRHWQDVKYSNSTAKVRIVCLLSSSKWTFYIVTDTPNVNASMMNDDWRWLSIGWTSYTYDGINYYYSQINQQAVTTTCISDVPTVNIDVDPTGELAVRYAFGDYASEGGPTYGTIKDLSYSTNIVGSGTTTGDANIDTISWYPYWDSNDNISTTWNIEIQVVPGTWEGSTNTDIFSQSYQDFIINESGATDIYRGTYLNGSVSISWGEVKNKLSILSWADLFQYLDGEYWNKKGWVYRARYNDPNTDYWSDWQTVYTVTSSNGEGVENIIDPSTGTGLGDFNNNVENSYNTTSIVNNTNNIVYYYNGVPVNTNVDDEEITDYQQKIYEVSKQIRDILINLNTTNSTTENNDNDETITNNLNSVVDDLHNTENQFMTDMDDKLNDIDRNVELLNDNKFIAAANWVRVQYDNIVSDTPFELLIVFGLVLSLALIIIGKIR